MLERTCLAPHTVARWASETPDAVALQHVDGDALTYGELHTQGRAWAAVIEALGVQRRRSRRDAVAEHVRLPPRAPGARLVASGRSTAQHRLRRAHARLHRRPLRRHDPADHLRVRRSGDRRAGRHAPVGASRGRRRRRLPRRNRRRVAPSAAWPGPEYRDIHSLMFTSGTTGPSKAVITPWAVMYQFWSWVPDDAVAAGEGVYCTMPMFHNSGRSAFNYALVCGARFVTRDRFSATAFWDDVRATDCRTAALIGPMTALIYSAPPSPADARQPPPRRDPRADDPRDRRLRAPLRRAHRDVLRPDRGGHPDRHRLGPRPVGELRAPADGLPVARRGGGQRARRAGRRRRGGRARRAERGAVVAQRRLLQDARTDGGRRGGTAGSTPATRSGWTTTVGTTSSTGCATPSAAGARTSRRSRWRRS